MIRISDVANKIETFLKKKGESEFKIFIRINFTIDVYVKTSNVGIAQKYQQEFIDSLLKNDDNDSLQKKDDIDSFYSSHGKYLKIKFYIVDSEEEDPFYDNIFANLGNNIECEQKYIERGPRYRFDSFLQNKKTDAINSSQFPPIVTFYSYKGGMGRTTTMVAYAISLATNIDISKRKKVVIIDCDLEAPGYLNFFDLSQHEGLKGGKKNGLVEFISDTQFISNPENLDINDYIINVGLDNRDNFAYKNFDNIWLVPAGNLNEGYLDKEDDLQRNDYLEGFAKINLSNIHSVLNSFNLLFDKIKEAIDPDIILIDSRTGFNDIFGTAALYLSSYVIGFFGFSRQTQPGLANLIKEYYKPSNSFKLQLVFSILPESATEEWVNKHKQEILEYINYMGESKDLPSFLYLHRNTLLEKIGIGDERSESEFVSLIQNKKFKDYNLIFESINSKFFRESDSSQTVKGFSAIQLRNTILKHLKDALGKVKNFAEDTEIEEKHFFYRECMKELFDPKKFLIQGYKGTGKTYLYKALADNNIASNIQKWAKCDEKKQTNEEVLDPIFVNILPTNDVESVFNNIRYDKIEETDYYFNAFWQIYTWNAILIHPDLLKYPEFESIKKESKLSEFIGNLTGNDAKTALLRIGELIDNGVKTLISIEEDIVKINDFLSKKRQRLFVLYDRLDTCINPLRWNIAVSPLIDYWRNNCMSFSNIAPKIFVRTDLFRQIEGTNTARLGESIIHIEWSIGEVFGYFFKLIFSNSDAANAYWEIAEKINIDKNYIKNTKKSFERFPRNQFKSLKQAEMSPIIKVFFGSNVKGGEGRNLGSPWDYFAKELANADNSAISLRPFIKTLDSNAVDKALAKTDKYVQTIIPSEIYASRAVRDKAADNYFEDLIQDKFSKDLRIFRDVIRGSDGVPYRFKSLTESQFEELIDMTFKRIENSDVVKSHDDLKRLISANGIMAKKTTTNGTYYRFASIYWYSWGLSNSALEKEERKKYSRENNGLINGKEFSGSIILVKKNGKEHKRIKCTNYYKPLIIRDPYLNNYNENDIVTFVARCEANNSNAAEDFWYATNIHEKE